MSGWWIFPTRIPEFLFGMLLFIYRDFLEQNCRKILPLFAIWFTVGAAIPTIYLFFLLSDFLNKKFPLILAWFNSFSGVSYMTMLTQHVILFVFARQFNFQALHTFGLMLMFCMVTFAIVRVSDWVKNFSDPIESWFAKCG